MSLWSFLLAAVVAAAGQTFSGEKPSPLVATTELPDLFLKTSGARVQTQRAWQAQQRRLRELLLREEYGPLPPITDPVTGQELASRKIAAIPADEMEILLRMGPAHSISTHLFLTQPPGKAGSQRYPVIIVGDLGWGRVKAEIVEAVVRRGYALAEFNRTEIAPDSAQREGVYAAYPQYTGGRLAAWAWGYHRVIDYLGTRSDVDRKRLLVSGHSRGGKAALLAGATDERIALTAPNNSGCGGAGCYRFQGETSEDIAAILKNFPYWFQPRFADFIGQVDRLPFDQHTLKALIAPRALLSTEALGDLWANPSGTQQTYLAAREVFTFLGVPHRIGITFRPGGHEQNAEDWATLLDFADWQLFGKPASRRFDALAFPTLPPAFTWRAPENADSPTQKNHER